MTSGFFDLMYQLLMHVRCHKNKEKPIQAVLLSALSAVFSVKGRLVVSSICCELFFIIIHQLNV